MLTDRWGGTVVEVSWKGELMLARRFLDRIGAEVSQISLGGGQIASHGHGVVSERNAHEVISAYFEQGGRAIDTARGYGESERFLGTYFQKHGWGEGVFVSSKTWQLDAGDIRDDLDQTLQLLHRDHVDLHYLHDPPRDPAEMDRVLDTYEQLKNQGKIRAIGASVKGADVTQDTVDLCRQYICSGRVDVLMIVYSIFRQKNREMLEVAAEHNVAVVARTVLEDGFLTGRYVPGDEFPRKDDPRGRWGGPHLRRILESAQELNQWAVVPPYENLTQVAIRFALDEPGICSVILGGRTPHQVRGWQVAASLPPLDQSIRDRLYHEYGDRDEEFNTKDLSGGAGT